MPSPGVRVDPTRLERKIQRRPQEHWSDFSQIAHPISKIRELDSAERVVANSIDERVQSRRRVGLTLAVSQSVEVNREIFLGVANACKRKLIQALRGVQLVVAAMLAKTREARQYENGLSKLES